jgi:hypothetical protein
MSRMPNLQSIEEIIRKECLPMRDCMLTITDSNGEAAFLYFKDSELIEANYAALWGKDALAQIVTWKVADRTLAPLPLGIKRSLWDQLARRVKSVGETLGFGMCEKWTVDTERYQVVGLSHDLSFITLLRRKDLVQDDLETVVDAIIEAG